MGYNLPMLVSDPTFQSVQQRVVSEAQAGQRIDNYLITLLKGLPKSRLYRMIRKGEVRINKKRVDASYKILSGDCVRIPPVKLSEKPPPVYPGRSLQDTLSQAILYEDADLIVINKPEKLAVHGGSGIEIGLIEALRAMRPEAKFLELVHRLDRDTSGCVMIAKKRATLVHLHNALQQGTIQKHYYALVRGPWRGGKSVSAPLKKLSLRSGERMVKVDPEGKASRTDFRILKSNKSASLLLAKPVTGRTHQIRVHCAFMGTPILGDNKYDQIKDQRLFLHAHQLTIPLLQGEQQEVTAPLPAAFEARINELFNHHEEDNGSE